MFSSEHFVILPIAIRPMSHFRLFFVYSVRQGLRFIFFPHEKSIHVGPFLNSLFYSTDLYVCAYTKTTHYDYNGLIVSFKIR